MSLFIVYNCDTLMSYMQNIHNLFEPKAQSPIPPRSKTNKNTKGLPPRQVPTIQNIEYKHTNPSPRFQYRNEVSQEYQIGQDIVKVLR